MSNSSVASFPAKSIIAFLPPGWSLRKLVTSSTSSPTITQQSVSLACFAISSAVTDIFGVNTESEGWQNKLIQV